MAKTIRDYTFRYRGSMKTAMQSLPIGNGDIGANVWLSEDGRVHFLLSKTDAWSELYRLLKTAHAVLTVDPCPFADGADFALSMEEGLLTISAGENRPAGICRRPCPLRADPFEHGDPRGRGPAL